MQFPTLPGSIIFAEYESTSHPCIVVAATYCERDPWYSYRCVGVWERRFREAIQLINDVTISKFPLLLGRIIGKLHEKVRPSP